MKFLCICQYGHSRSVAMCRVLHARGHEAVAVGWQTCPSAIERLCAWADVIVVMQGVYVQYLPQAYKHAAEVVDVGPDRWSNPYNSELLTILEKHADVKGW